MRRRKLKMVVPAGCSRVGADDHLDLVINRYRIVPDGFADACSLPFPGGRIRAGVLLGVVELVFCPDVASGERAWMLVGPARVPLPDLADRSERSRSFMPHGYRAVADRRATR